MRRIKSLTIDFTKLDIYALTDIKMENGLLHIAGVTRDRIPVEYTVDKTMGDKTGIVVTEEYSDLDPGMRPL